MLCIDIGSDRSGVTTAELTPSADDLGLDPAVFSGLEVQAEADREGDRVFVRMTVSGTARLQCDRTLVDYDHALDGNHSVLFVPPEDMEEFGEDAGDVRVLEQGDQMLDITEAVRDTLMLAIPVRRIAPGAEDLEIETRFGADDDEVDPRWEALKALKGKDDAD